MDYYCNKKRYRAKEPYSSYKNKRKKYSNRYSNERNYDSCYYNSSNDRSYSYKSKRNDYDLYDRNVGHNNCYYVY